MNFKNILSANATYTVGNASRADGHVYFIHSADFKKSEASLKQVIEAQALSYQVDQLHSQEQKLMHFNGKFGPIWIVRDSGYGAVRDRAGQVAGQILALKLKKIQVHLNAVDLETIGGFVIGFEMSMYNFLQSFKGESSEPLNVLFTDSRLPKSEIQTCLKEAIVIASSIQLARHLVNLPPNLMHPESFEQLITRDLNFSKSSTIRIWNAARCKKERLNLLLAVGEGAEKKPRLIHIKYRPRTPSSRNLKPVAFVGKGITFDTGGLDIKPSGAMRLMKKDMGGAAAVLALAHWVDRTQYARPCDFYLALAENAVDAKSMRPGDVYQSRAGFFVEIDNTDAEGRLVLADAMDVAVNAEEKPSAIIDVATLTGAIKVALGAEVAGLFCNDDELAGKIFSAGQEAGEPNWRMPLVKKYWSTLNSNFADFRNSGEGFGGAITAALFLEKFCGGINWAHLDIYAWADRAEGAIGAPGGNGQAVQTLIRFLKNA